MARKSNLSAAVLNVILMTTVAVHVAMLQSLISTRIMVQKDRSCAKYAPPHSLRKKPFSKSYSLKCPHCNHSLAHKKDRKHFVVHKCVNPKCPYYLHNLNKVDKKDLKEDYGKNKYKLHYIYREFQIDFFRMDLNTLPKNASS